MRYFERVLDIRARKMGIMNIIQQMIDWRHSVTMCVSVYPQNCVPISDIYLNELANTKRLDDRHANWRLLYRWNHVSLDTNSRCMPTELAI